MSPKVILVQITVKPDYLEQFDELILTNARISLSDETGCRRFDVLVAPDDRRRLCQSNGRSSARGATRPPLSDIYAATARHSANAAERLCL
jgi:hypothetical protein